VAGFIGSPKMNLIGGRIAAEHGAATIGIRPEHITLSRANGSPGGLNGVVQVAEHLGSDTFLYVDGGDAGLVTARAQGELGVAVGDRVTAHAGAGAGSSFRSGRPGRSGIDPVPDPTSPASRSARRYCR
jgi:multiple sugar transport system ATP-binding protein